MYKTKASLAKKKKSLCMHMPSTAESGRERRNKRQSFAFELGTFIWSK
jgi:hypothetical protein